MKDRADRLGFLQEFSMLASLHHPNIVTFYGISEDSREGILYIVNEFCAGGDLSRLIAEAEIAPAAFARIATELLGAVRYMHDKGIAHRDLKPANVLLTEGGQVKGGCGGGGGGGGEGHGSQNTRENA
jgi:serine/threonine-protein kinase